MAKKRYRPEEIIGKLREDDVLISQGKKVMAVIKALGITDDWDDGKAACILRNCRDAMGPDGKVLVVETVIPSGKGACFGKWLDLMMLVVGGRERTREEYERLFSQAGLRLTRVVPTSREVSVIEGVRANDPPFDGISSRASSRSERESSSR